MKQNVTLSLEKDLLLKLKVLAARRSTSMSHLMAEELARLVEEDESYERSKRIALAAMEPGFSLGGKPMSREEVHRR
ncbi:MAG: hypothetical protein ACPG4N_01330 [Gammaproteobacteria bacterium]